MKLHDYRQTIAYMKRRGFADGTPPPKPQEPKRTFNEKIETFSEAAPFVMPRSGVAILKGYLDDALKDGEMTQEEYTQALMPLFGETGEMITEQIAVSDRENFQDGTPGKSAFRKPFPPEIEKQIIKLHQVDKMGAQAIADELGLSRSPVGKRITALKKEGKIKDIPYAERKASIDQRGDLFGKAPGEKYLTVREIRDVDRKAVDKSTGKSLYNIPEKAKFKVNFGNTDAKFADITNIPEEFIGVKYFNSKETAEKALAKRKKLKLIGDEDPDPIRRKANKKKYDLVKEVSDNNIERVLADFKKGQPLEQAHRLSLNQVKKTGELYNVMNLGLDFDDPKLVQINNELVKPYENKLKQLYTEQNKLYKKASNLKTIPKELQKQIEFNNLKISSVVDLAGGRVQGLQLDEFTLKPKVTGVNYANVLGFGIYDKPVKELTDVDRAGIGAVMQGQIENEKKTAGKTAQKLFQNKQFLKDVDKLAVQSMVPGMTTADKIPTPEKTKTKDMFKEASKRFAKIPGLNAKIPLITDLFEMARDIPGDLKRAKYLSAGLKTLGIAATPLVAYDSAKAFGEGKPVMEALEQGFIGTNVIGGIKDYANLSDEAKEAKNIFSQQERTRELSDQVLGGSLGFYGEPDQDVARKRMLQTNLPSETFDAETLNMKSEMSEQEAKKIYDQDRKRVAAERAANESTIANTRKIAITNLMDLIKGKRFQGEPIPQEFMATGGRVGFADGPDDPSKRKFIKIGAGLMSLPFVGKYFKAAAPVAEKTTELIRRGADGIPDFIMDLIAKVKLKAEERGMKYFTGNRSDEFADVYQADNFVVTQQGNKINVKKVNDQGEFGYKEHEMELDIDPETGGMTYNEGTIRPDAEGKLKDIEEFIDEVDLEDMKKYTYDE